MAITTDIRRFIRFALLMALIVTETSATNWTGGADLGAWYLKNNLLNNASIQPSPLLDKSYSLFFFNLRAKGERLFDSNMNFHLDGNALLNPYEKKYALGVEQNRFEMRELALEFKNIFSSTDVWIGRQRILEAGNVGFDGLRTVFHVNTLNDLAFYGGFASNPRTYLGYIGPYYEIHPFVSRLQAFGGYFSTRATQLRFDLAVNTMLFDYKMDRAFAFSQMSYTFNPVWTVSGLVQMGLKGFVGLENLQANIMTKPNRRFTNTVSFYRTVALQYNRSLASTIPPYLAVSDATLIGGSGNDINTTSYNTVREHFMFNLLNKNYIFAAGEYSKRTFDHLSRKKYTMGFHEPELFATNLDFRIQSDLIQNYRGFNSSLDILLGQDFADGRFRIDAGATLFSNERDVYANNAVAAATPRQSDEEYTLRTMLTWVQGKMTSWNLSYAYIHEVDATNNDQDVNSHELFLMTHFGF